MVDTKAKEEKYVVDKATIMPATGSHKNKKCRHGDIISLERKEARYFSNLGYLRPYVEDDYNEDDFAGTQNISEGTTSMAGAVEGADPEVSEVDIGMPHDPGTKSQTAKPELRGNPEGHPSASNTDPLDISRTINQDEKANVKTTNVPTDRTHETKKKK